MTFSASDCASYFRHVYKETCPRFFAERADISHFVDSLVGDHPQRAADATVEIFGSIYRLQNTVYNIGLSSSDN